MSKRQSNALALAGCAAFVLISSTAIPAQDTGTTHVDTGSAKMMKSADMKFAMAAAQGGVAEVQMGELAVQKAANPEVRAFGQQMIDDHSKANDELKSIAANENITLPTTPDAKEQGEYTKLSTLSGAAFDRAYVKDMVKDHEEDIKQFQKEAEKGKDPGLKSFAARTLPILQAHLQKIKSIQGNMSGGA